MERSLYQGIFDEFLSLEIADMNGRYQLMIELEDEKW